LIRGICKSGCAPQEAVFELSATNQGPILVTWPEHGGIPDFGVTSHCVLVVTTLDDERYVIDLTGAQYGQFDALVPEGWYRDRFVQSSIDDSSEHCEEEQDDIPEVGNCIDIIHDDAAVVMNNAVAKWEADSGYTVTQLVRESPAAFQLCKTTLLEEVRQRVAEFVEWVKEHQEDYWRSRISVT
jgi:hypothetical protein